MSQVVYNAEVLAEAFAAIETQDLHVTTVICNECGCVLNFEDKETKACEHLIEMFSDWHLNLEIKENMTFDYYDPTNYQTCSICGKKYEASNLKSACKHIRPQ